MIRYMITIFGINCKNQWVTYFLTGLTIMVFSLLLIQILVIIEFKDNISLIVLRILCTIVIGVILANSNRDSSRNGLEKIAYKQTFYICTS